MYVNRFLGRPYVDGVADCYGLVRDVYKVEYGIQLRNYARPLGFDHEGLNLLAENFQREGFEALNIPISLLEPGDGLLFQLASDLPNHVGIHVDQGRFLHHLYRKSSSQDFLDLRWQRRLVSIVRHPDVTEFNRNNLKPVDALSLLPPHLRRQAIVL